MTSLGKVTKNESFKEGEVHAVIDGFQHGNISLLINDPRFVEGDTINERKQKKYGYAENCRVSRK